MREHFKLLPLVADMKTSSVPLERLLGIRASRWHFMLIPFNEDMEPRPCSIEKL